MDYTFIVLARAPWREDGESGINTGRIGALVAGLDSVHGESAETAVNVLGG